MARIVHLSDLHFGAHDERLVEAVAREVDALKPDLVVISTPNATHVPLARRALEVGAHVVVDKPFAVTSTEARGVG